MGVDLIQHILKYHVNTTENDIPKFAFWEYINSRGEPWIHNGQIISDPGHSLEFVGLALKFTSVAKTKAFISSNQSEWIEEIESILPQVLVQTFKNGFQEPVGGICKTYDLIGHEPINSDMPWCHCRKL